MNFQDYQKAAYSTCTSKCFTSEYLNPGYLSEAGEIAGKIAKKQRGDNISRLDMAAEIGDCAWMIAVKALKDNEPLIINKRIETHFNYYLKTGRFAGKVDDLFVAHIKKSSNRMKFRVLMNLCDNLGVNFHEALAYNTKKLASRKQRGVIQGEGDNR